MSMDEFWDEMLEGAPAEKLLPHLTPEDRLRGLTPEQLLRALSPDDVAHLKELIDRMPKQPS